MNGLRLNERAIASGEELLMVHFEFCDAFGQVALSTAATLDPVGWFNLIDLTEAVASFDTVGPAGAPKPYARLVRGPIVRALPYYEASL